MGPEARSFWCEKQETRGVFRVFTLGLSSTTTTSSSTGILLQLLQQVNQGCIQARARLCLQMYVESPCLRSFPSGQRLSVQHFLPWPHSLMPDCSHL